MLARFKSVGTLFNQSHTTSKAAILNEIKNAIKQGPFAFNMVLDKYPHVTLTLDDLKDLARICNLESRKDVLDDMITKYELTGEAKGAVIQAYQNPVLIITSARIAEDDAPQIKIGGVAV